MYIKNSRQDATDLVAKLCAAHSTAQKDPSQRHQQQLGLDLVKGVVRNCVEEGVLEPAMSKVKIIQVHAQHHYTCQHRCHDVLVSRCACTLHIGCIAACVCCIIINCCHLHTVCDGGGHHHHSH